MASAVKPHFGTADTEPENFHHHPETSIYHCIFNRRPSLLFHKRKWKPRRGSPGPPAPSPADAPACALLSLLLQRRPLPTKAAPISLLSCAQKPGAIKEPPCSSSLCPAWLLLHRVYRLLFESKMEPDPCGVHMSSPFQPQLSSPHRRYFEVVPLRTPTC